MKGVILAGGEGTRLYPMTKATNKHLLPIYDKPMVYYPIQNLVDAGITEIMVVTGGTYAGDFIKVLRNGEDFGLKSIAYAYQEGSGGIADALMQAKTFVGNDSCVVVLGDNLIFDDLTGHVKDFENSSGGARVFTKIVNDPERFGVMVRDLSSRLIAIVEKPKEFVSNEAIIGLYMYDSSVFDKIEKLSPSDRNELEVTDLNNMYLRDKNLSSYPILGDWIDCGTPESLARATQYVLNRSNKSE